MLPVEEASPADPEGGSAQAGEGQPSPSSVKKNDAEVSVTVLAMGTRGDVQPLAGEREGSRRHFLH